MAEASKKTQNPFFLSSPRSEIQENEKKISLENRRRKRSFIYYEINLTKFA